MCMLYPWILSWHWFQATSTNGNNEWVSVLWQNCGPCTIMLHLSDPGIHRRVFKKKLVTKHTQDPIGIPNRHEKPIDCFEFLAIQRVVQHCPWNSETIAFSFHCLRVLSGSGADTKSFLQSRHVLRPPWRATASSGAKISPHNLDISSCWKPRINTKLKAHDAVQKCMLKLWHKKNNFKL